MSYLALKQAQARWVADENDNQWKVVGEKGETLTFLPASLEDQEVMNIIRFGRQYEDIAFKEGVEMGKQAAIAAGRTHLTAMSNQIAALEEMNIRLSEQLERHILMDDEI